MGGVVVIVSNTKYLVTKDAGIVNFPNVERFFLLPERLHPIWTRLSKAHKR